MKYIVPGLGFLLFTGCAQQTTSLIGTRQDNNIPGKVTEGPAQPAVPVTGEVFTFVEQMPEFPGGQAALMDFLKKNIRYPAEALANKEEGRVVTQFVVLADGTVTDANVVRNVSESVDKEALRVISIMPRWKPGKQNGRPVNVRYMLPISFATN